MAFRLTTNAQDNPSASPDSSHYLQEVNIVYQATRLTPVTFLQLTKSELSAKHYGQEPSFILSGTPSITVYSDAGSTQGYSYFRLRGIDQTRVNMTLDGMPLNEPEDQGAYFSNYPDILSSVGSIQVQRGVGTTKNGNASYGGSVQLTSPSLFGPTRLQVSTGYGSFNSFRANAEYNSGIKNNKGLYVRASHQDSDGYKHRSANNAQSVFISSGLFAGNMAWKIKAMAGNQRNQMAWLGVSEPEIAANPRTNANANEDDRFSQGLLQLQHTWSLSKLGTLNSSLYYNFLDGNYDFDYNNFLGQPSSGELYNYAFRSNFVGFFSNYSLSSEKLTWTTGLHANAYNRRHTGSEKSLGQLYRNRGFKDELSVFSKMEYSLQRLLLYADLQYRVACFDYAGSLPFEQLKWQFLNPRAGLSYTLNPATVVYYNIGMTGREPTRNDIFGGEDDLLADDTGAPLLANTSPEQVVDQEMGIRHQTEKLKVNANLFYMDFSNEIVLNGNFGPNGLALTNKVDNSVRAGAELNATYSFSKKLSTTNNSSFTHSRIMEQEVTFSPILTPPVIINQEVAYTHSRITLALAARYQSQSYIDFANSAAVADYFLLNARAHLTLKRWELALYMNNLTNTRYFNNGYIDFDGTKKLFVQAPANLFASVKYSF
jgi:iron complex outermembrane recepter protein